MDEQTFEAIKEMKFLYECGADLDFLELLYPMQKENIQKFCKEEIWQHIDWDISKSCLP